MADDFDDDEYEVQAKLAFLFLPYAKNVFRHFNPGRKPPANKNGLAKLLGVKHNNFSVRGKPLSDAMCADIAKPYGFDMCAECIDCFRFGKFQAFKEMFEQLHGKLGETRPTAVAQRDTGRLLEEDWDWCRLLPRRWKPTSHRWPFAAARPKGRDRPAPAA